MEDFTPIKDHETYGINKKGEVLDLRTKKLLKQYPNRTHGGYLHVGINTENGYKSFGVHRLMGLTFIPNPDNKPQIDHIDRNVINNNIDNLRWATPTEQNYNQNPKGRIPHKYIMVEDIKNCRNNTYSWRIVIKNGDFMYRKRFNYKDYTLEQIIKIRNDVLLENNLLHLL